MNIPSVHQRYIRLALYSVLLSLGSLSAIAIDESPGWMQERLITDVLKDFGEVYEVFFTYDVELLKGVKVDFEFRKGELLQDAITRLLADKNLTHQSYGDKFMVIYQKSKRGERSAKKLGRKIQQLQRMEQKQNLSVQRKSTKPKELFRSVIKSIGEMEQELPIRGTVTDESGNPLIGATILVRGTSVGTSSDLDGTYQLNAPDDATTLIVSYTGYSTQEIEIGGRSTIDIQMTLDISQLEEIVVVGYGAKKKVNLIGSVSTVSSEDLGNQSITSAGQAISGRVPGVQIIQGSAQPGKDDPIITIRGVSTIRTSVGGQNEDTAPLVIVDGIQSTINDVHPQDIENISIIKDASSAAIYGARAANGVILITTKRGENKKPRITLNSYYATQSPTYIPETLNPYEYALLRNESRTNVGRAPDYDAEMLEWFRNYKHESWADFLYVEGAPLMNHHLAVSGGSETVKYMVSGGFQDHDGVIINTNSKRYNIRSNIDVKVSDKIKAGINFSASMTKFVEPTVGLPNFSATMLVRNAIRHPPFALVDGVIKPDGHYSRGTAGFQTHSGITLADAEVGGMTDRKIYRAAPNLYLEYEPIQNLLIKASGSVYISDGRRSSFAAPYLVSDGNTLLPRNGLGQLRESYDNSTTTLFELTANYTKTLGKSVLSALAGFSDQTFESDYLEALNQGYSGEALQKLDAGSISPTVAGRGQEWALRSGFGRLGYSYDNKYLLEFNIRYDGSSRFGPDNRWGVFPSFSVGWRVDQESFMQDVDFIDNLKLRANWGQLGNQNIGNYRHVSTIALDQAYIFNNAVAPGAAATTISNPNIKWETTTMTDVGIDLGLFNNRLSIEADYYVKTTDNILLTHPYPSPLEIYHRPHKIRARWRITALRCSSIILAKPEMISPIVFQPTGDTTTTKSWSWTRNLSRQTRSSPRLVSPSARTTGIGSWAFSTAMKRHKMWTGMASSPEGLHMRQETTSSQMRMAMGWSMRTTA